MNEWCLQYSSVSTRAPAYTVQTRARWFRTAPTVDRSVVNAPLFSCSMKIRNVPVYFRASPNLAHCFLLRQRHGMYQYILVGMTFTNVMNSNHCLGRSYLYIVGPERRQYAADHSAMYQHYVCGVGATACLLPNSYLIAVCFKHSQKGRHGDPRLSSEPRGGGGLDSSIIRFVW